MALAVSVKTALKQISLHLCCRCCCGQSRQTHPTIPGIEAGSPGDVWLPNKHTRPHATDAYGTIEFQGGAHPTKAQVNDQLFSEM